MSKRLIRIAANRLSIQLPSLLGREVSAVLNNGKTYFGRLISQSGDKLVVRDSRSHLHELAFSGIYEIVYDASTPLAHQS